MAGLKVSVLSSRRESALTMQSYFRPRLREGGHWDIGAYQVEAEKG